MRARIVQIWNKNPKKKNKNVIDGEGGVLSEISNVNDRHYKSSKPGKMLIYKLRITQRAKKYEQTKPLLN